MTFSKLIKLTSKLVERPATYGTFHILFLIAAFAGTFILARLLRNTNEKQNKAVLLSCGGFLLLTEIYKQLYFYIVICNGQGDYPWYILPFQMCSIPMYLCLILPFLKEGRVKDAIYDFLASYNFLGGFTALLEPSGVFNEHLSIMIHSLAWHTMLVFIGFYLVASGRAAKSLKKFHYTVFFYYFLALIAFIIDASLWKRAGGGINMFFVGFNGPGIIVYQQIFEKAGWAVSTILFTTTFSLGAFICLVAGHYIHKLINSAGKKKVNTLRKGTA